jgi:LemA protein
MDPLVIALIAIIVVVVLIGLFFWATYNGLVKLNIRVDEAWSDITVQLKRRADLNFTTKLTFHKRVFSR